MRFVRVCCVGVIVTTCGFKCTDVEVLGLCCWVMVTHVSSNAEAILLDAPDRLGASVPRFCRNIEQRTVSRASRFTSPYWGHVAWCVQFSSRRGSPSTLMCLRSTWITTPFQVPSDRDEDQCERQNREGANLHRPRRQVFLRVGDVRRHRQKHVNTS